MINKKAAYSGFLLILIVIVASILFLTQKPVPEYTVERVIKYNFTVSNPGNKAIKKSAVWTYIPVKNTSTQQFVSVDASHDYKLEVDSLGNQKLHFELQNIPPYGTKIITIVARVNMSKRPNDIEIDDAAMYLNSEKYIESDNESILSVATELNKNDSIETAKAIYQWILDDLEYKGFISEDRGALFALENGYGDCTEFAYLYTALARAAGLPARSIAGFVYSENARLKVADYHNWSEVRLDDGWWLVDSQKETYMDKFDDYIAMRILSEGANSDSDNSQKYFHVDAPLVMAMN